MSHTGAVLLVAMFLLVAFLYGVILWRREGQWDRTEATVDEHDRLLILLEGRINNLADYLGVDIHDPVPDGPDEWEPEGLDAPRAMEPASLEPIQVSVENHEDEAAHSGLPDDTDEIPVCPPTVPDGMPLAVQSALIAAPSVDQTWEQRRAQIEAEWEKAAAEIGGAA